MTSSLIHVTFNRGALRPGADGFRLSSRLLGDRARSRGVREQGGLPAGRVGLPGGGKTFHTLARVRWVPRKQGNSVLYKFSKFNHCNSIILIPKKVYIYICVSIETTMLQNLGVKCKICVLCIFEPCNNNNNNT